MSVESIERLIVNEVVPSESLEEARKNLKNILLDEDAVFYIDLTLPEVITALAKDQTLHPAAAACLVRFLAVPDLIPEADSINQIARNLVSLCERSLPDLCEHLRISEKKQNVDKYTLLLSAHRRICELLKPFAMAPNELQLLVANRQSFLQAINQGIVKAYCSPFGITQVRLGIESLLSKLGELINSNLNFISDLDDCNEMIKAQLLVCEVTYNFLTNGYYKPFLQAAALGVAKFADGARAQFSATLSHRLPASNILQKRYPLHEAGREISIAIPLRNEGPGLAKAAKASIETDSEDLTFAANELSLGNIPPGDFSAIFDALVLASSDNFSGLVTLSWEQTGDAERKHVVFEVQIAPQRADIDWAGLERQSPYNTAVATGSAFVGRSEKILTLANKLLRTPMESFYVTGQKRVGKTSLALAVAEFAKNQDNAGRLSSCNFLWGDVALGGPRAALRAIGTRIANLIKRTLLMMRTSRNSISRSHLPP